MSAQFPQYWINPQDGGEWVQDPNTGQWMFVPAGPPTADQMGPGGFDTWYENTGTGSGYGYSPVSQVGDINYDKLQADFGLGGGVVAGSTKQNGYNQQVDYNRQAKQSRMNVRPWEAQAAYDAMQEAGPGVPGGGPLLESAVLSDMENMGIRSTASHGLPTYTTVRRDSADHNGQYLVEIRIPNDEGGYDIVQERLSLGELQAAEIGFGTHVSYDNVPLPQPEPEPAPGEQGLFPDDPYAGDPTRGRGYEIPQYTPEQVKAHADAAGLPPAQTSPVPPAGDNRELHDVPEEEDVPPGVNGWGSSWWNRPVGY